MTPPNVLELRDVCIPFVSGEGELRDVRIQLASGAVELRSSRVSVVQRRLQADEQRGQVRQTVARAHRAANGHVRSRDLRRGAWILNQRMIGCAVSAGPWPDGRRCGLHLVERGLNAEEKRPEAAGLVLGGGEQVLVDQHHPLSAGAAAQGIRSVAQPHPNPVLPRGMSVAPQHRGRDLRRIPDADDDAQRGDHATPERQQQRGPRILPTPRTPAERGLHELRGARAMGGESAIGMPACGRRPGIRHVPPKRRQQLVVERDKRLLLEIAVGVVLDDGRHEGILWPYLQAEPVEDLHRQRCPRPVHAHDANAV